VLVLGSISSFVSASDITVKVTDQKGKPLTNIVVMLRNGESNSLPAEQTAKAVMDQINREFVPHALVVQQGTRVSFPNSDSVQHHVYSFSPAKTFELKLYSELEVEPLLFEKAGVVELGCNVHDWMLGYIYVADTPYFGQTDKDGVVSITAPKGDYQLSLWHPRLSDEDIAKVNSISVADGSSAGIQLLAPLLPSLVEYDAVEGFSEYD
jgi:plastocyanin